jgi:type IV pilus assembly protein PilX
MNHPVVGLKRSLAIRRWRIPVQKGASLIIVLIMLGVIALTSAATLRNASSNERVSHNFRMHALALQYAEAALRYCETQMTLDDALRVHPLKESNLFVTAGSATPVWRNRGTWSAASTGARTSVPVAFVASSESAFKPGKLPDCAVEKQALDNGTVYVITARGFSSDYTADARGFTVTGSVVWLQTLLSMQGSEAADRTWRRILNPPID